MSWRAIWLDILRVGHQTAEYQERDEADIEYPGKQHIASG